MSRLNLPNHPLPKPGNRDNAPHYIVATILAGEAVPALMLEKLERPLSWEEQLERLGGERATRQFLGRPSPPSRENLW